MTEREKMLAGQLYAYSDELGDMSIQAKLKMRAFNDAPPDDEELRIALLKDLFGKTGEKIWIEQPLHVDHGVYTEIGEQFYANFNLVILDSAPVKIGDRVMFGPNVALYTATHPLDAHTRNVLRLEYARRDHRRRRGHRRGQRRDEGHTAARAGVRESLPGD